MTAIKTYRRRAGGPDVRAIRLSPLRPVSVLDELAHDFGYAPARLSRDKTSAVLRPWGADVPTLRVHLDDVLFHDPRRPGASGREPLTVKSRVRFDELYQPVR